MIGWLAFAALSFLLTALYRWLALRYRWLDAPNQRSSHRAVTPRGAGIVFATLIVGASTGLAQVERAPLLFLPSFIVALIGWCDDLRGLSARIRFLSYGACATVAVALIAGFTNVTLEGDFALAAPLLATGIATLGLLWLINLYNFMDGINGIATMEALFVLLAGHFLAQDTPYIDIFSPIHGFASAALIGFLGWNFPGGKVFMGDAGSAFLGCFIGTLMLLSDAMGGPALTVWLILLGVFVVDTAYTLAVRVLTGQTWYAAHRLHAYQRLTDRLGASHTRSVGLAMAINIGWLLPLAWLVQSQTMNALAGLTCAYVPLVGLCYWLKAGVQARGGV